MSANKVATVARAGMAALGLTLATAAFGLQSANTAPADQTQKGSPATTAPAPTAAPAAPAGAADLQKGRELFSNWGCNSCHVLADADASGHVGPPLDGNPALTRALVVDRVTNGQGPMPAFGGQMTDEEIGEIATYITQVAVK